LSGETGLKDTVDLAQWKVDCANVSTNNKCGPNEGSTVCPKGYCSVESVCCYPGHESWGEPECRNVGFNGEFDIDGECKRNGVFSQGYHKVDTAAPALTKKEGGIESAFCKNTSKDLKCGPKENNTVCSKGHCSGYDTCCFPGSKGWGTFICTPHFNGRFDAVSCETSEYEPNAIAIDFSKDAKPATKFISHKAIAPAKKATKPVVKAPAKKATKPVAKAAAKKVTKPVAKVPAKKVTKPEAKVPAKKVTKPETKAPAKKVTKPESKAPVKKVTFQCLVGSHPDKKKCEKNTKHCNVMMNKNSGDCDYCRLGHT